MSLPYGQQQQPQLLPPSLAADQQAYTTHSGRGSVGPVIGALAVIIFLLVISVMIGRLCTGRRVPGLGQYDFEGWFERKFASCVGMRVGPPQPRPPHPNASASASANGGSGGPPPVVIPVDAPLEAKQTTHQSPPTQSA